MNKLPPIQGLWVGNTLDPIAQLSIKSFMAYGHPYHLYTYEKVQNVPEGVEIKDGNEILPARYLYKGRTRGYAPFSDWFRWTLMREKGGIYMDLDIVALRALDLEQPIIICYEEPEYDQICGAALKIPSDHPLVTAILDRCENPKLFFLKYLIFFNIKQIRGVIKYSPDMNLILKIKKTFGIIFSTAWRCLLACIPKTEYNSKEYQRYFTDGELAGPKALTSTSAYSILGKLKKTEIDNFKKYVLPREAFYPVRPGVPRILLRKGCREEDLTKLFPDSYAVHIWANVLKWSSINAFPEDCWIALMAKKYDVDIPLET